MLEIIVAIGTFGAFLVALVLLIYSIGDRGKAKDTVKLAKIALEKAEEALDKAQKLENKTRGLYDELVKLYQHSTVHGALAYQHLYKIYQELTVITGKPYEETMEELRRQGMLTHDLLKDIERRFPGVAEPIVPQEILEKEN